MARVYLAESLGSGMLRKLVVLKVLNQELAADPDMRRAFLREAEISAHLNHPNIVHVTEVFEQGGTAVMVMQHLEGMTLSEIMSRLKGAIPLKLHINVLCQVLAALHYFHEIKDADGTSLECVHRDVSPDNVMVLHEGGVKVVDFGVAKVRVESENHTRAGVIKGKIAYMPPEQLLASAHVDRRADIYSVGVMLWEAVAGRRMWRGMDASVRMRAIVKGEIPDLREAAPGVPDALVQIVHRALAHTPDARFATAEEMQIDLEQVALTQGGHSGPRELAEFMRANFGDERREKKREIERIVGDREYSLAGTHWTVSEMTGAGSEKSGVQAAPSVATAPKRGWRKPLAGAVIVAAACFAGALLATSSTDHPRAVAVGSEPSAITLRVDAEQAGAEVYVDGIKAGDAPLSKSWPSASKATVELRVGGQTVDSQVVSLQADTTLQFTSHSQAPKPEHVEEGPPTQPEPRAEPRAIVAKPKAKPVARPAAPVPAEPAPTEPAAPKASSPDSCDPPYRLDPGGVKVFKPHCF